MARELNFKAIEDEAYIDEKIEETRSWRQRRREENPTVQMSVRVREDVYDRFKRLALKERYSNGAMLEVLLENYLTSKK